MNLKPVNNTVYPPFKNGKYMEEYFDAYWSKETFPEKDKFVYLDIYWLNVFFAYNMNPSLIIPQITDYITDICKRAKEQNKIVFTICQWDDGICMGDKKPENLIVFSIGQSTDVPLPLIIEDRNHTLRHWPRKTERDILASFIGTCTHSVRNRMVAALLNIQDIQIHLKDSWTIDIPENNKNTFIDITLRSKFGIAPRGYGPSSFRFFEIMELGVIPVYVHDGDNALPYKEILDYDKFSISIHIDEIEKLPELLKNITDDKYTEMIREMNKVALWFTPEGMCYYVKQYLVHLLSLNNSISVPLKNAASYENVEV